MMQFKDRKDGGWDLIFPKTGKTVTLNKRERLSMQMRMRHEKIITRERAAELVKK